MMCVPEERVGLVAVFAGTRGDAHPRSGERDYGIAAARGDRQ